MAADGAAPWSRWDSFSGTTRSSQIYSGSNAAFVQQRQFDSAVNVGQTQVAASTNLRGTLLDTRYNPLDPNFYDCVYGVANTGNTIIEQCYKEIGCCNGGCCENGYWKEKYGWAVALIVIFCILVIIAFAIWLGIWLLNRAKDKRQKRQLINQQNGISPAPSHASLAQSPQQPAYYPYGNNQPAAGNGYRY